MREAEKGVEGAAFLFAPRHGEEGSFTVVLPPALIFSIYDSPTELWLCPLFVKRFFDSERYIGV